MSEPYDHTRWDRSGRRGRVGSAGAPVSRRPARTSSKDGRRPRTSSAFASRPPVAAGHGPSSARRSARLVHREPGRARSRQRGPPRSRAGEAAGGGRSRTRGRDRRRRRAAAAELLEPGDADLLEPGDAELSSRGAGAGCAARSGQASQEHAPGELEVPPGYGVLEAFRTARGAPSGSSWRVSTAR